NASAVHVAGDFNSWSASATPLASEPGGYWSNDISAASIGDEYQYVITNGGWTGWKNDPYAEEVTNSVGNSIVYDDGAFAWSGSFSTPAWNEMVIYEMHIGTFNDTPGGLPGDFDDAIARLNHLQDLGVNAVKVMPVNEFAGDFSWGYNPAHPFTIESVYGGPEKYKLFIQEAHDRGIAVIQDVVYNHLGPSDLDLWQFDGWSSGGLGGIYFFQDWRAYTPWGATRPDYGRGEVRQYLRDNALRWLNDFRVDGLRWDSTVNIRTQNNGGGGNIHDGWTLMQWINNEIDAAASWKISIAEDLQNNEWVTKTTGSGGAGFDAQWDAAYVHPMRDAVITANDWNRDMFAVRDALYHRYNGDAFERVIYTESHDEVANGHARVPEEISPGNADSWWAQKRSTLGAAVTFTAPGIPMIFQGQEVLEDGYFQDTDPVDWTKETTHAGIEALYKDLIRLRRNWYNNTRGLRGQHINAHHINNSDKVIAYHRYDSGGPGDDVIVIANFSSTAFSSYNIGMPRGGTWNVRFNSDWNGYSSVFGNHPSNNTWANWGAKDGMSYNANISVGPYTVVILSQ
ncbi:MAG: alpha-amylase family glycosyl hydrolase, partial [Planctomycetota bacterium]